MLKRFKLKLTKRNAARKERSGVLRVRGLLERLEDRAMLSASYGSAPAAPILVRAAEPVRRMLAI